MGLWGEVNMHRFPNCLLYWHKGQNTEGVSKGMCGCLLTRLASLFSFLSSRFSLLSIFAVGSPCAVVARLVQYSKKP